MIKLSIHSLAQRIFIYVGLTMLCSTLVIVVVMVVEFRDHVNSFQSQSLQGHARDIARNLKSNAHGELQLVLPPTLVSAYNIESEQNQFAVLNHRGVVLFASREWSRGLTETRVSGESAHLQFQYKDGEGEHVFRAISLRRHLQSKDYYIQVAQSHDTDGLSTDSALKEFLDEVLWVMLALYGLILLVMYGTVRSVLKPLKAVSEQASSIAPSHLDIRLPTEHIPTEILPMVQTMNKALDRLEEGYRIQREFTANAAHEIRTPLAVLRAHIEASEGRLQPLDLLLDLARLERIVAQLLNLAQMDNLILTEVSTVNLHAMAVDCASQLAPVAIKRGKVLAVTGECDVSVQANEAVLGSAVRNLLENAIFYSEGGSDIELRIDATPAISILDRGPGIAEADRENLFKRFWRGNSTRQGGAGLGLSIVVMIVEAHHAQVSVANREGGGAAFTISFPKNIPPEI